MNVYETTENYLETIYIIEMRNNCVRSIDVVNELKISKPTVSVAMKKLREEGYISVSADGHITLNQSGREIAETMYERHVTIAEILISIGVEKGIAFADACKIEHDISEQSFECLKQHFNV